MPVSRQTSEGLARAVVQVLGDVETRVLRMVARYLAAGVDSPTWALDKLQQLGTLRRMVAREVDAATADAVRVASQQLLQAYTLGRAAAQGDLDDAGLPPPPVESTHPERAVSALVAEVDTSMRQLGTQVLRSTEDIYRTVVQQASAGTLTGATTRLQDAQQALDRFAMRGITGFTDRAGRRWELATYTEMAVRSATTRAATEGHLARLADAGIDLVMVSDSPRECETCRPWEGKVLSRGPVTAGVMVNPATGRRVRVDVAGTVRDATSGGLFHPNCTHTLSAYLPGVTRRPRSTANPKGYQQRQELRGLERKVREWKRREAVAVTPEARAKARRKVREYQARIRAHVDASGLIRQRQREQIGRAR